jgi:predicted transcriptional regulator
MSTLFTLDITEISLIVSVAAIVIVIIFFSLIRHQLQEMMRIGPPDSDASALVSEFMSREKRMEERLVDEKVRLEILELRMQRQLGSMRTTFRSNVPNGNNGTEVSDRGVKLSEYPPTITRRYRNSIVENRAGPEVLKSLDGSSQEDVNQKTVLVESVSVETNVGGKRDRVVSEILEAVYERKGSVTAREIQAKIGRSREHTARMMNLLYKQGLVSRNAESRPFTYSLTEAGQRELNL